MCDVDQSKIHQTAHASPSTTRLRTTGPPTLRSDAASDLVVVVAAAAAALLDAAEALTTLAPPIPDVVAALEAEADADCNPGPTLTPSDVDIVAATLPTNPGTTLPLAVCSAVMLDTTLVASGVPPALGTGSIALTLDPVGLKFVCAMLIVLVSRL